MKDSLKQRLVGAVVLAALAVIFLPGFLKEQQIYQVDTDTQIPPQPTVPHVDFQAPQQVLDVEPAPAPETMFLPPEPEPASATELSVAVESPQPSSNNTGILTRTSGDEGIPEAWVVQVASLGNKTAANKLRDELQAEGHKAYVRSITTAKGSITRVFIGPKLSKAEAMAVKAQVDKRLKVNSLVRSFEP